MVYQLGEKLKISGNKLLQHSAVIHCPVFYSFYSFFFFFFFFTAPACYLRHKFIWGRVGRGRSIKMGTRDWQFTVRRNWQSLLGNSTEANRATYRWQITPNGRLSLVPLIEKALYLPEEILYSIKATAGLASETANSGNSIKGWSN